MTTPIERINALTQNAKSTWFALLSALLFVGVTLMGVEHVDFYGVDRATQLPLINVSVPTPLFFYGAPLLIAAIYSYFHLYLIRLWDALGAAPARPEGTRLGEAISPWLVSDAALYLRRKRRADNSATPRSMELPSAVLNATLAWGAGLGILIWLWWASMPARDFAMTAIAAAALFAAFLAGAASLAMCWLRMNEHEVDDQIWIWSMPVKVILVATLVPGLASISFLRTGGSAGFLAPLILTGENLVEKPANWLPEEIARKDFQAIWCKREGLQDCNNLGDRQEDFEEEWSIRRKAEIAALSKPTWSRPSARRPDLREAELQSVFLAGADLSMAQMQGADFIEAQMQRADLEDAQMQGADLKGAQMQGADLEGADLEGADLEGADLVGANLQFAELKEANLYETHLQFANFMEAQIQRSNLIAANLKHANLNKANLSNANLFGANLQEANLETAILSDTMLSEANIEGANLYLANLESASLGEANLENANLTRSRLQSSDLGSAIMRSAMAEDADLRWAFLSNADLVETNFTNAKMEGAELWEAQMQGANLSQAKLQGTELAGAQMQEVNFGLSYLTGTFGLTTNLEQTNLSASINNGGGLRYVDLRHALINNKTDWRNAFFDSSVLVPEEWRDQIGQSCLWDWIDAQTEPLSEKTFMRYWRGWLTLNPLWDNEEWWLLFAYTEWQHVDPIAPPEGCQWFTDPLE